MQTTPAFDHIVLTVPTLDEQVERLIRPRWTSDPGFTQLRRGNPMFEELMNAYRSDLRVSARDIEQRMEWERLVQIDRRERPLRTAKGRLQIVRWLIDRVPRCRTPRRSGSSSALPTHLLHGNQTEV